MINVKHSRHYSPSFSHQPSNHVFNNVNYGGVPSGAPPYFPMNHNEYIRQSTVNNNEKPSARDWRSSNDYREEYFEKNKGIGGYGYICSQCWKPMRKGSKMHVDHIIPPSKFAKVKKIKDKNNPDGYRTVKTSFLSVALNNSFNCAAICPQCNYKKSNKINTQIISGYAMKSLEVAYSLGQVVLSLPIMATAFLLWGTRKGIGTLWGLRK